MAPVRRFLWIGILFCIPVIIAGWGIVSTMFVDADYWSGVHERNRRDSIILYPVRGDIYSADGDLLAVNQSKYRLFIDFGLSDTTNFQGRLLDSVALMDTIVQGMNRIIPGFSEEYFRERFRAGREAAKKGHRQRRSWHLVQNNVNGKSIPKLLTFVQYKDLQALPLFRENKNRSGIFFETLYMRDKPFGSLAAALIGNTRITSSTGHGQGGNGIERAFDSLLTGQPGILHREKVRDQTINRIDQPTIPGTDIQTTLDIGLQDFSEKVLRQQLIDYQALKGVVVIMETHTGDVKTLVNLQLQDDGAYREKINHCFTDLMEPGSTFKTASLMVALDDGKINYDDEIDTGNGIYKMYGSNVRDHNAHRGGYGRISVPETLIYSSNVATARLIDENYKDNPARFVEGIYRVGMGIDLKLPFINLPKANIRMPKRDSWWKTTLPWMSFGYETQVPLINTVAFYNAIANNGCMVSPRFVKAIRGDDGQWVEEFPTQVLIPQICKPQTLKHIQDALHRVVHERSATGKLIGTGKPIAADPLLGETDRFHISGKTGTAQVLRGDGTFTGYLLSFCGYFPSEAPRYTMMVAVQTKGGLASGGIIAGGVFKKIANHLYVKGKV